jgi:hypothetical protein
MSTDHDLLWWFILYIISTLERQKFSLQVVFVYNQIILPQNGRMICLVIQSREFSIISLTVQVAVWGHHKCFLTTPPRPMFTVFIPLMMLFKTCHLQIKSFLCVVKLLVSISNWSFPKLQTSHLVHRLSHFSLPPREIIPTPYRAYTIHILHTLRIIN